MLGLQAVLLPYGQGNNMKKLLILLCLVFLTGNVIAGISEKNLEFIGTLPSGEFCDSDTADECEDWDAAASPNNKRLTWTDDDAAGTIDHAGTPSGTWACDGTYVVDITHSADTAGDAYTYHQLASAWSSNDTDYWLEFQFQLVDAGAFANVGVGAGTTLGGLDSVADVASPFPLSWSLYKTGTGTYEMRINYVNYVDGTSTTTTLDYNMSIAVGTVYTFKFRWRRVTDANDQLEVYFNGSTQNSGGDLGKEIHSVVPTYLMLGSSAVSSTNYNMRYKFNNIQIKSGTEPGTCSE